MVNAQNEQQNWPMMNGEYASTRYSRLRQINRDADKDLRLVWKNVQSEPSGQGWLR